MKAAQAKAKKAKADTEVLASLLTGAREVTIPACNHATERAAPSVCSWQLRASLLANFGQVSHTASH